MFEDLPRFPVTVGQQAGPREWAAVDGVDAVQLGADERRGGRQDLVEPVVESLAERVQEQRPLGRGGHQFQQRSGGAWQGVERPLSPEGEQRVGPLQRRDGEGQFHHGCWLVGEGHVHQVFGSEAQPQHGSPLPWVGPVPHGSVRSESNA
ncbi:hypothetical protein LIV37_51520 [Streptomyces rapamycinicus NRRL 5491]|nr:hypothetical protein LIV37_51520 [Streptomyces rapamycinicus NRRL 5491]